LVPGADFAGQAIVAQQVPVELAVVVLLDHQHAAAALQRGRHPLGKGGRDRAQRDQARANAFFGGSSMTARAWPIA